ncbi:tumor necrosis factor receptor superfamily member 14 [Heptranchias perlo]|uniref:tumor necrosis factor receptor superfamily member 14 n=1 Tax=Heptranchias perlo TaxID=212740 RepID=UPI00355A7275
MSNSTLSGMRQCSDKEYSKAKLCCLKCSAGFYKQKDCTETLATDCQPCKSDEYMDYQNHASYCLRCAYCGQAGSNLETIAPCTRTVNTQCRCRTGHYCSNWQDKRCERCKRVSSCGSGEGVNEKATLSADTKCETCPSGTFSNVSDTQSRCLGHTR